MGWGPNCWWWGPGYFSGGPWNMIIGTLFWVLILVGLIYFFSWMVGRPTGPSPVGGDAPLEILKRRYASGEISAEEFGKIKKHLL